MAGEETLIQKIYKLLAKIWTQEDIPQDWKKGIIVKLPKKGDLSNCGNWRGITLIAITAKIMGNIIIDRIAKEVDQHLRQD